MTRGARCEYSDGQDGLRSDDDGFGMRHDSVAHDAEPGSGRMTHDEIAEIAFSTINACHTEGIHDPARQAHTIAVALLLARGEFA